MPNVRKCQACRELKKAVSALSRHDLQGIETDGTTLFSVYETPQSGMNETLTQDANAAKSRTLTVAPTNSNTRTTKRTQYLALQALQTCSR